MSRVKRRQWEIALVAAGLVAPWGCDGGGAPSVESSRTEAKVHGSVKARGKSLTSGEVVFNPANSARPDAPSRTAPIGKDGTYEVTTLVGLNSVRVAGPPLEKDPQLGYAALRYDVKSGDNTFDVELPPK
jgi:hypothetical protein